jgi:hypothetical protein
VCQETILKGPARSRLRSLAESCLRSLVVSRPKSLARNRSRGLPKSHPKSLLRGPVESPARSHLKTQQEAIQRRPGKKPSNHLACQYPQSLAGHHPLNPTRGYIRSLEGSHPRGLARSCQDHLARDLLRRPAREPSKQPSTVSLHHGYAVFLKKAIKSLFLIRFERLRGIHIIIIFTWVQYQIRTLTFIIIVSLSFLKTKF